MVKSKPAKGTIGFLMRDAIDNKHFFRVYDKAHNFTDYKINHHDLQVVILEDAKFYETDKGNFLDYEEF